VFLPGVVGDLQLPEGLTAEAVPSVHPVFGGLVASVVEQSNQFDERLGVACKMVAVINQEVAWRKADEQGGLEVCQVVHNQLTGSSWGYLNVHQEFGP
jgi:hypothetical protein